ncbi:hypothetical protein T492DRAFT_922217, partial [Pavlovales sp. CCMP2436]
MFAFLGLGRSGPAAAARGAPSSQPSTEALPSTHRPALSRVASPAASPRRSSLARPPLNSPAASPLRSSLARSLHNSPAASPLRSTLAPSLHSSPRLDTLRPRSPGGGLPPVPSPGSSSLEPAPQRTTPAPAAGPAAAPDGAPADVRRSFEVVDALFRTVVDRPDDLPTLLHVNDTHSQHEFDMTLAAINNHDGIALPTEVPPDGDPGMHSAIALIFGDGTVHLFCLYHIYTNLFKHMSKLFGADRTAWHAFVNRFWRIAKLSDSGTRANFGQRSRASCTPPRTPRSSARTRRQLIPPPLHTATEWTELTTLALASTCCDQKTRQLAF